MYDGRRVRQDICCVGLLLLMLILLFFLIISVVITLSNRGNGEWEEIGWSDTLDAYVGIRR